METESTGDEVRHKPHPRPYGCGCGDCTLERYREGGCPNPLRTITNLQYLDTKGLTESQRDLLIGNLLRETREITFGFQTLVSNTRTSFKEQRILPQVVVAELGSLKAFSNVYKPDQCLGNDFDQLHNAQNLEKVFSVIQDYMSFINPGLLEQLIEQLGSLTDKERFQKYQEELKAYCKRRVVESPSQYAAPKGRAQVVIKTDKHLEQFTLEELLEFQSRLSKIFKLTHYTLLLCTVDRGCVRVTFHIPRVVADQLFPLTPKQEKQLESEGVMELYCGDYSYTNR